MSILIKGMEMPRNEPLLVKINPDGSASTTAKNGYKKYEAVPVPPHGRLIDSDALPWEKQGLLAADEDWALPCTIIENAPAVIEAEEGEA